MGDYDLGDEEVIVVALCFYAILMFLLWVLHLPLAADSPMSAKVMTTLLAIPVTWLLVYWQMNRGD